MRRLSVKKHATPCRHGATVSPSGRLKMIAARWRILGFVAAFAASRAEAQDLSAAMASGGMAWAAPNVADYSVQASNAMYAISGVYAHPCVKAWEWRAGIRTKQ